MKRTIAMVIVFLLVLSDITFAEVDLSGMSYDELVILKDRIDKTIWDSQEWQEVTVPQGLYKIGEDIPAGKWTILASDF